MEHLNVNSTSIKLDRPVDYRHRTLPHSHIRLLKIQPGCADDQVRCTIHHFDLQSLPAYVAVSYRWGTNNERISIQIERWEFELMSNAWWSLHYLRNHQVDTYVWIDAICIDQTNISERNAQVQLMSQIFSNANEVIIWLGMPDEHSVAGFDALHSALRNSVLKPNIKLIESSGKDLLHLLHREYWSRIWIVQEIIFARKLSLVCGEQRVTWDFLETFMVNTVPRWRNRLSIFTDISNTSAKQLVEDRNSYQARGSKRASMHQLGDLLKRYRNCGCLDSRDRVYGLVGLYNDHAASLFKIDYNRSTEDLLMYTLAHISDGTRVGEIYHLCAWLQELLELETNEIRFQCWLRPRLRFSRRENQFHCYLDSGEMVLIPVASVFAQKGQAITSSRMLDLNKVSIHEIQFWLDPFDEMDEGYMNKVTRWLHANQDELSKSIVNAPTASCFAVRSRLAYHHEMLPAYSFEHMVKSYSNGAPINQSAAPKAVRGDLGFAGVVCSDAQEGDFVALAGTFDDRLRYIVVRPCKDGFLVVGNALMQPGYGSQETGSETITIQLDPLNALALSAPIPLDLTPLANVQVKPGLFSKPIARNNMAR